MKVRLKQELEIDIQDLAKQMTPEEMFCLFTEAANMLAEGRDNTLRRDLAFQYGDCMSENAKVMLADLFAAEYTCRRNTQ